MTTIDKPMHTPWSVSHVNPCWVLDSSFGVFNVFTPERAAFIVLAVNRDHAFDELVKALANLLDKTEEHVFGECLTERNAAIARAQACRRVSDGKVRFNKR